MNKWHSLKLFVLVCIFSLVQTFPVLAHEELPPGVEQLDLICQFHGHVVADPHPVSHGNYPANVKSWHDSDRFAVDLQARKFCDPVTCAKMGPESIVSSNAKEIVLDDRSGATWTTKWTIRRRDGWSIQRFADNTGRIELTTGPCRKAKFSGLAWHLEGGRVVQGPPPQSK